ncbi:MAG TPA: RNA chaperone ProQ, partial [Pasteurellaceae bacterium]|nr:RNA chaperone ProQ [Pasteurellaceae bacterium]
IDLQGNPSGVLEQEHVEHAAQQLAEAKAKFAEKRAAEKASNAKANKKSLSRKPVDKQQAKPPKKMPIKNDRPKIKLMSIDFTNLHKGDKVKVKVGESAKEAVVLDVVKENVRVELENGLVMCVTPDRLFA